MSVVVGKRKESKFEPVWQATILHDEMLDFCIRRLGIKDVHHLLREKYRYENSRYYSKEEQINMVQDAKKTLMEYMDGILTRTRLAYATQSDSLEHCDIQRKLIEEAEMYCELTIGKLQTIIRIFQVDINAYTPYVKMLDEEIRLLRKWKRRVRFARNKFSRGDF